jgi:hypothetical protein
MPFDNNTRSCWTFFIDLHDGHVPAHLVPILLERHAIQCNCPCQPCQQLKQRWVEAGHRETNGAPTGREFR